MGPRPGQLAIEAGSFDGSRNMMPQLTDNVGAEIGYDAYLNDGDGG